LREKICQAAVTLARTIGYQNAGTVEFIFDQDTNQFYFLEMNTRIQVEHPVTEMITGVDLVAQQFLVARGVPLTIKQSDIHLRGHAIECRINAESPQHGFRPCPGGITHWRPPQGAGIRVDSHCFTGYFVPPYYDSLLAKLIVHGGSRSDAAARTRDALAAFVVEGIDTGIPFLRRVIEEPDYLRGNVNTRWLEKKLEQYSGGLSE
jgi:acetyl-CoA carboxylase biotin carboxylase subunit